MEEYIRGRRYLHRNSGPRKTGRGLGGGSADGTAAAARTGPAAASAAAAVAAVAAAAAVVVAVVAVVVAVAAVGGIPAPVEDAVPAGRPTWARSRPTSDG